MEFYVNWFRAFDVIGLISLGFCVTIYINIYIDISCVALFGMQSIIEFKWTIKLGPQKQFHNNPPSSGICSYLPTRFALVIIKLCNYILVPNLHTVLLGQCLIPCKTWGFIGLVDLNPPIYCYETLLIYV